MRVADLVSSGEAEIKTGPFGTQLKASEYVEHGTPVINVRNIGFGGIRPDKLEFIAEETVNRLSSHLLRRNDIVFGRKGAVERHVLIQEGQDKWFQGSDCLRLRLKSSKILPRFVSYYLLTREHQEWMKQQCSHGATMASLNQDIVGRIEFPTPDLKTQFRITSTLSVYDDLIENNTRRISILKEMARRIYEEWFVRFRFPGHENVRMVESELGRVPEGWRVGLLGDDIELPYGKALKAENRTEGNVPVYGSSGVVGHHASSLVNGPGIILGRKGNVGSVHWSDVPFYPIDTVFYVRTALPLHFVYFNLQTQNFLNNDAAVPGLNRNQAYSLPLLVPDDKRLAKFENLCDSMLGLARLLMRKNINLRTTRDLLLPKLISGELDVSALPDLEAAAA